MKASEINLKKEGFLMSTKSFTGHYSFLMSLGRCVPCNKNQAKKFFALHKNNEWIDVLNMDDVHNIETVMNKHGFEGSYKYTKSKEWVRLMNTSDLAKAYKLEYNG